MPGTSDPNVWSVITAILVTLISGLLAIAHRLTDGQQKFSWLWFLTQMGGAVLAGYLMWDLYPLVKEQLPVWCTQPIMISLSAHYGGKFFSLAEFFFKKRYNLPLEGGR